MGAICMDVGVTLKKIFFCFFSFLLLLLYVCKCVYFDSIAVPCSILFHFFVALVCCVFSLFALSCFVDCLIILNIVFHMTCFLFLKQKFWEVMTV